jgi:tRNA pseudouridine13 synthase
MKIKDRPEDFIVEEIPSFNITGSGDYAIYRLWKRNLNTEEAVHIVCERFNIDRKRIKYAGIKDRNAQTTQYISIFRYRGNASIEGKDLKLEFVGFCGEPLSLGCLSGNKFTITIKEVSDQESGNFMKRKNIKAFPNYFDDQRFSRNNSDIGLHIIRKDYASAINLILESDGEHEKRIREHIEEYPGDFVGAIKKMPEKILGIYLHSVQSRIFNDLLSLMLMQKAEKEGIKHKELPYSCGSMVIYERAEDYEMDIQTLPMIGFDTVPDERISKALKSYDIGPRDFIIKSMPEHSMEEQQRRIFAEIDGLSYDLQAESITLEFTLPKGCYATMLIKALFN